VRFSVEGQDASPGETSAISRIDIRRVDVFSEEEVKKAPFFFRLANALHIETREKFIRRQLTIELGDPIEPEKLLEAERSLRTTDIFRKVSVRSEGTAAVVETRDAWSLFPRLNLSRKGGDLAYTIGLEESNLGGRGRKLEIRYDKDGERLTRSLSFQDPQLFLPHFKFQFQASDLSDGQTLEVGFARPFYAFNTREAAGVFYRNGEQDEVMYAGGEEAGRYKKRQRLFHATGGMLLALESSTARRLHFGIDWNDVDLRFDDNGTLGPLEKRRFCFLWTGFEREETNWIVRRQVDKIDRDEDFNLGLALRLDAGFGIPVFGAERALALRLSASLGELLGPAGFSVFTLSAESRFQDGGPRNTLVEFDARGYKLAPPATLAFRVGLLAGYRLDPERQIHLDALSGMRGYRLNAVTGTGRAVANVEGKIHLASEVLQLVSLAVAAFADAGVSWGDPDGFYRICDVGVGLRFGLTRASTNTLLRLDVARALRPDPLGRTGWLISFSSGPSF
jgi:hypothetical protein